MARPIRHFFDPYHDMPLEVVGAERAPDWALEDLGDFTLQDYSYKDARESFYRGLTAQNGMEQEREIAHTFYALGHVIHLIQDMAQPQHTRNDMHPSFIPSRASLMEQYINVFAGALRVIFDFDSAAIPVTTRPRDLWVTATGDQMTGRGMAEFSNINFVSAGTNFSDLRTGAIGRDYPRPALDTSDFTRSSPNDSCHDGMHAPGQLVFYANALIDPTSAAPRRNERMTTFSIFDQHLIARGRSPIFALNCFNLDAAASILLPRAVSYSAALLQYFFRGRIEIAPPDRFVYGLAPFLDGNTGAFTGLRFKVRNATPSEEAGGPQQTPGQMVAVIRYRTGAANPIETPSVPPSAQQFSAVSKPVAVALTRTFQEVLFDFTDSPLPTNAVDVFLTVVWRGQLGLESDAILVGSKDLFEPDAVDIANVTDYFCFAGQPYYVPQIPPFDLLHPDPMTNPQPWRDKNLDGYLDIFGPETEPAAIYTKLLPLSADPFQVDYVNQFDFLLPERGVAQYSRFFVLQDQPAYLIVRSESEMVELGTTPNFSFSNLFGAVAPGHVNRRVHLPDGRVDHEFTDSVTYRGVISQNLVLLLPGIAFVPDEVEAFQACVPSTTTAAPSLHRIEGIVAQP
ncbi:MAG TPA: hypothetical protein VMS64_16095 [Candidatus Methylomirabilis sp.]|nr:hypothetical protein [Candidatus Methylomirabilis sp.]